MKYTTIFGLPIVERIVDFDQGSYPLRSDTELNIFCFTASLFHLIVKTWNKNEAEIFGLWSESGLCNCYRSGLDQVKIIYHLSLSSSDFVIELKLR